MMATATAMAAPQGDSGQSSSRMQQPRGGDESPGYGSSGSDFDFGSRVDGQAEAACSAADELFFNGKILPLELAPRMAAMGIHQEQEQDGRFAGAEIALLLRRGRSMGRSSTSSTTSSSGSGGQPYTRKSSSYPPCGNKSSSIFRDLFGGGGSSSGKNSGLLPLQPQRPSKVFSSSKGLLKRVFANWSTSSSSSVASSVASVSSLPVSPSSSPARSIAQLQQGKRKPSAATRRKAGELAPASVLETRSAPASPLSPHVRPRMAAGVSPILHLGGFKQQQQLSAPSYYPQHRRKPIVAA